MSDRRSAFEHLFRTHAVAVHRYVYRRVQASEVDDVVADVFLVAWQKFDTIPADFEVPWLYRTAWNVIANRHRKFVELPFDALPDDPAEGDLADSVIEDALLRQAWIRLGARDREILRLAAWEGLDGRALADALGISVSGAGVALSRARERLAAACAAESDD